jgi:hypothetical protein
MFELDAVLGAQCRHAPGIERPNEIDCQQQQCQDSDDPLADFHDD